MAKFKHYIFFVFVSMLICACISAPDYPNEPEIEFIGLSKSIMTQNNLNTDSVFVTISFTDGDGDLGFSVAENEKNVFVTDMRTGFVQDQFKTPEIPEEGTSNGISGNMRLLLYTTCCIFPEGIPPCESPEQYPTDTLQYEIYIMDRAGNESNRITTSPIVLRCE